MLLCLEVRLRRVRDILRKEKESYATTKKELVATKKELAELKVMIHAKDGRAQVAEKQCKQEMRAWSNVGKDTMHHCIILSTMMMSSRFRLMCSLLRPDTDTSMGNWRVVMHRWRKLSCTMMQWRVRWTLVVGPTTM